MPAAEAWGGREARPGTARSAGSGGPAGWGETAAREPVSRGAMQVTGCRLPVTAKSAFPGRRDTTAWQAKMRDSERPSLAAARAAGGAGERERGGEGKGGG